MYLQLIWSGVLSTVLYTVHDMWIEYSNMIGWKWTNQIIALLYLFNIEKITYISAT